MLMGGLGDLNPRHPEPQTGDNSVSPVVFNGFYTNLYTLYFLALKYTIYTLLYTLTKFYYFFDQRKIKLQVNLLLTVTPQYFQGFVPFQNQEDYLLRKKKVEWLSARLSL